MTVSCFIQYPFIQNNIWTDVCSGEIMNWQLSHECKETIIQCLTNLWYTNTCGNTRETSKSIALFSFSLPATIFTKHSSFFWRPCGAHSSPFQWFSVHGWSRAAWRMLASFTTFLFTYPISTRHSSMALATIVSARWSSIAGFLPSTVSQTPRPVKCTQTPIKAKHFQWPGIITAPSFFFRYRSNTRYLQWFHMSQPRVSLAGNSSLCWYWISRDEYDCLSLCCQTMSSGTKWDGKKRQHHYRNIEHKHLITERSVTRMYLNAFSKSQQTTPYFDRFIQVAFIVNLTNVLNTLFPASLVSLVPTLTSTTSTCEWSCIRIWERCCAACPFSNEDTDHDFNKNHIHNGHNDDNNKNHFKWVLSRSRRSDRQNWFLATTTTKTTSTTVTTTPTTTTTTKTTSSKFCPSVEDLIVKIGF
jgi:hypothetical protein